MKLRELHFTNLEMAEILSAHSPKDLDYVLRQIRNFKRHEIIGPRVVLGKGVTSPGLFDVADLFAATLGHYLVAEAGLHYSTVRHIISNFWQEDDAWRYIERVISSPWGDSCPLIALLPPSWPTLSSSVCAPVQLRISMKEMLLPVLREAESGVYGMRIGK